MFDVKTIAICVLVILVIILLYRLYTVGDRYSHNYFQGIWIVDTKFARDAELTELIFYVDGDMGYLYILAEQGEIFSGVVTHKLQLSVMDSASRWYEQAGKITGTLSLNSPTDNENLSVIYPEKIHVILIPTEGCMIWKNGDETLAILRKDNITT